LGYQDNLFFVPEQTIFKIDTVQDDFPVIKSRVEN